MRTVKDLLIWYNNLDVVPFMEAAEKMVTFYKTMHVDVFKDCISVPGLTLRVSSSIDTTRRASHAFGVANSARVSWASTPMPCTSPAWPPPCRRGITSGKTPGVAEKWLDWMAYRLDTPIRHRLNHTEKRIGDRQLPVDGFAYIDGRPTVFQFYGCYFHFHGCHLNTKRNGDLVYNQRRGLAPEDLQNEVNENEAYIESLGYELVTVWECQFHEMVRTDADLHAFMQQYPPRPTRKTQNQLLEGIVQGELFGFVECDIHVPDHLKPDFAECPPIFKNAEVSINDIGPTMADFARANNLMPSSRRMLIGSMFGEKILLATPLLQWYLAHGLEVTHIHQAVQYTPERTFQVTSIPLHVLH